MKRTKADQLRWVCTTSGLFEVRLYYRMLNSHHGTNFPWKSIWQSRVPHKVAFFTWLVAQGKILTIDNLRRRRIWLLDWCFMCKKAGESVNHLMLHCESNIFLPATNAFWYFDPNTIFNILARTLAKIL